MARKKKLNWLNLIFAIVSPLLIFSGKMIYDHFIHNEAISIDIILSELNPFFEVLKSYQDYIFPFIFCLAISLIYMAICYIKKSNSTFLGKLLIFTLSLYIIMTGSRYLFVIVNKYTKGAFEFIHDNINLYTFSFASMLDFLIMWITNLFTDNSK